MTDALIRLHNVTKTYPGQEAAAVDWRERSAEPFQTDAARPIDPRAGQEFRWPNEPARREVVPVVDEAGRVVGWVRR